MCVLNSSLIGFLLFLSGTNHRNDNTAAWQPKSKFKKNTLESIFLRQQQQENNIFQGKSSVKKDNLGDSS
jgi:hypothetical protein